MRLLLLVPCFYHILFVVFVPYLKAVFSTETTLSTLHVTWWCKRAQVGPR